MQPVLSSLGLPSCRIGTVALKPRMFKNHYFSGNGKHNLCSSNVAIIQSHKLSRCMLFTGQIFIKPTDRNNHFHFQSVSEVAETADLQAHNASRCFVL